VPFREAPLAQHIIPAWGLPLGSLGGRVAPAKGSRTLEAGSIGAILAQFKSITAKRFNILRATPGIPVWQRNYFEHIIRDEIEFGTIRNYPHSTSIILKTDKTHAFSLKTYGCCQDRHSNPTLIHTLEYRSLK